MLAGSAGALIAATSLLPGQSAFAQALPAGCTDGNNNIAEAGEVVTCLPPPSPIGAISTTVDDLTINVGNAGTPTEVRNNGGTGANVVTSASASINIYNSGSDVSGSGRGIDVTASGASGAVSTVSEGDVFGGTGEAVYMRITNASNADDITISVAGEIGGGSGGIDARHSGTGGVSVTTGNVSSVSDYAARILQFNSGNNGNVSFSSTGLVLSTQGILARNDGSGDASVLANNITTTLTNGRGVLLQSLNGTGSGDLSANVVGTINSNGNGVEADQDGTGGVSIYANNVYANSSSGHGILVNANSTANTGDVTIVASGYVTGFRGILATRNGSGNVSITANDVRAFNSNGVWGTISSGSSTGDISLTTTGTVLSRATGLRSDNSGLGAAYVRASGDITSTNSFGVIAINRANNSTGNVYAHTDYSGAGTMVSGSVYGIYAASFGAGSVTVNAHDVSGGSADGIFARLHNASSVADLAINTTGSVSSAASEGINASHAGSGNISISVNDVTGTRGVLTDNTSGSTTITIADAATVTGTSLAGVQATSGTSSASITLQGSSGDIIGATDGVDMSTAGADITVQNLDSVTGQAGDGIDARSAGGNITVSNVGTVLGTGGNGLNLNPGSGDVSVQGVGLVGGFTGTSGAGILIDSNASGAINIGGLTANGNISGSTDAIFARTTGPGSITIAAGDLTATNDDGIDALNDGAGGDVSISVGAVNAGSGNFDFGIYSRNQSSSSGSISVTATGDITSGASAVFAANSGTGVIDIDVVGAQSTYGSFAAIDVAAGTAMAGAVTVDIAGPVIGAGVGVDIDNNGAAPVIVTLGPSGVIDGNGGAGVYIDSAASSASATATVRGSSGSVVGSTNGIEITTAGTDIAVLELDSVTGEAGNGIILDTGAGVGNITVSNVGSVLGTGGNGIILTPGTGDASVQGVGLVGGVTGTAGDGIYVTGSGAINIGGSTAVGTATGADDGIEAVNIGTGAITIAVSNAYGGAAGGAQYGVRAFSGAANAGDIDITVTGIATSYNDAVRGTTSGLGSVSIDVANANSSNYFAVVGQSFNTSNTEDMTITSTGLLQSLFGVYGRKEGSGTLSINVNDVTTTANHGVQARIGSGSTSSTDFSITSTGTITATSGHGVFASQRALGGVYVSVGDVASNGAGYDGVQAFIDNGSNSNDIMIISTGAASGGDDGIDAFTAGTGNITINANNAYGGNTGGMQYGVIAYAGNANAGNIDITVTGTATSYNDAVRARTQGLGAVSINAANANSSNYFAVVGQSFNDSNAQDMTITSSGLLASANGVYARHDGSGDIIMNLNHVTANGTSRNGITAFAYTAAGSSNISITSSGDITGTDEGIYARSIGTGGITINTSRVMSGSALGNVGVYARGLNGTSTSNLTITSDYVYGGQAGVWAENFGSGDIIVNVQEAAAAQRAAVYAEHYGAGEIDIDVGNAYGGSSAQGYGVWARMKSASNASGISITSTGNITSNAAGIRAENAGVGGITISAYNIVDTGGLGAISAINSSASATGDIAIGATGMLSAANAGIDAVNNGAGGVNITATGVMATSSFGVRAETTNSSATGDFSISTTGSIDAGGSGAYIRNYGYGATMISVADVTSANSTGLGAYNTNASRSADTTITATGVVTGVRGVYASHEGSGDLTIQLGDVTVAGAGAAQFGVYARTNNSASSGDIALTSTGTITAISNGVFARNQGDGSISVDVADVTSAYSIGVRVAQLSVNGGDVAISSSGLVDSDSTGVRVGQSSAAGNVLVGVNDVASNYAAGIEAYINTSSAAGGVTVTATGDISGASSGVYAGNAGAGGVSVSVLNVTSTASDGIFARTFNSSATGDVEVTATGSVSGSSEGVQVRNYGYGALVVDVNNVMGASGAAIDALVNNGSSNGALSVTSTGTVMGGMDGVNAQNDGGGDTAISVSSGAVTGTAGYGVNINANGDTSIMIASASSVSGGAGAIYVDGNGNASVVVNNAGTLNGDSTFVGSDDAFTHSGVINGDVNLGTGVDSFTIVGDGAVINSTISGGGDAGDVFTSSPDGSFFFGGAGGPHEIIGFDVVNFASGMTVFDGVMVSATSTVVDPGASLMATGADSTFTTASFVNNGATAIAAGTALSVIGGGFTAGPDSNTIIGFDGGFGQIITDGDIVFNAGSTVTVDVSDFDALMDGLAFDAFVSTGGMVTDNGAEVVIDNSALFDFMKVFDGPDTLQIVIEQAMSVSELVPSSDPSSQSAANALQQAIDGDGEDAMALSTFFGLFEDADELSMAIDDFVLDESNGAAFLSIQGLDRIAGVLNDRINQGDLYDASGGLKAGTTGFWSQGFFGWGDNDPSAVTTGFDSDLRGIVAGADHAVSSSVLVGASYYYLDGDTTETGTRSSTSLDMKAHGVFAYLAGRSGPWRAKSSLGYGWTDYEQSRRIVALDDTALASYDGHQFTAQAELGYALEHGAWTFTPLLGFRYLSIETDAYEETGSTLGAAIVDERSVASGRGEVGLIASYEVERAKFTFAPEAHVRLQHEFLDPADPIRARFRVGGGSFQTFVGGPDDFSVNAGASVAIFANDNISLRAGYDATLGDGYQSHGALVSIRGQF